MRRVAILVAAAVMLGAAPATQAVAQLAFTVEDPDPAGSNGLSFTSIALDAQDNPHVTYAGPGLRYARKSAGAWTSVMVDASGDGGSLAMNAFNEPAIAYVNAQGLTYAEHGAGVWVTDNVSPLTQIANASLAFDGDGKGQIAFVRSGALYAATQIPPWDVRVVDDADTVFAIPSRTSIAVDPSNGHTVHVSYLVATTADSRVYLRHAWKTGVVGPWTIEDVDGELSSGFSRYHGASIEIDSAGGVYVAYSFQSDPVGFALKYAVKSGGVWAKEVVEGGDGGERRWDPSLQLDAQGNPHIAYFVRVGDQGLKYASKSGGAWTLAFADSGLSIGEHASLALDAQGLPHISCGQYAGDPPGDMLYIRGSSPLTSVGSPAGPGARVGLANSPNPFVEATRIRYDLPARAPVRLDVYDAAGRLVRRLVDAPGSAPGAHETVWDGTGDRGEHVGAGVYFYRLQSDRFSETRSMVLLR